MTQPGTDWDRLGRYVAGELSPAEAGDVQRWLAENSNDAKVLAALDAATKNLTASRPVDVEAALRRVKGRLAPRTTWRQYATWAAAAAIVVTVVSLAIKSSFDHVDNEGQEYATTVGVRDSVVLADGSRVILGPATKIDVHGRRVDLIEGEAFFVVVHNAKAPFTVHAGGTTIRDIGTEFSVHSDRESEVRVVVREGSVQLSRGADSVVLSHGDVGTLQAGQVTASRGAATPDDLAWTTGKLVFRDAPVTEVAADLRRWYGVELKVTDSALLKRHFTGTFGTEPSARVIEAIALSLGARAERRGDTAYIRPAATNR